MRSEFVALIRLLFCLFPLLLTGPSDQGKGGNMSLQISSAGFSAGEMIPKKFTCDGPDVSPKLSWGAAPEKTQSFALIMDDPDAPVGTWVHWVLFDLPANINALPEDVAKNQHVPAGGKQGLNDFKHLGYGGPCPPPGKPHRYFFKLYALDSALELKPGATKKEVERAMNSHIV